MRKTVLSSFILFGIAAVLFSCGEPSQKTLPAISGKVGEIGIIASRTQWESEIGDAIRGVLADEYPYIPQREPRYRLFNVPEENFNNIFQVHRNLFYVKIADTCSTGLRVQRDVWASPQTMLVVTAPSKDEAAQFISTNGNRIQDIFEEAERERVIVNAKAFPNKGLESAVSSLFGGSPYLPSNYTLKKQSNDFLWISYETSYTTQGIFIYKFPYEGSIQFSPKYLIDKRDEIMKAQVPATREGSYMITNTTLVPGFEMKQYGGREFAEVRTLWDTHNDFMGGPFISNAFLNPDKSEIIVIEGFVYAPKYDKRDYLRQVEALIYSWHWE